MPGQPPPRLPGRPARIPILVAAGTPRQQDVAEIDTRTLAVQAMDQALKNAVALDELLESRAVTLAPPAGGGESLPAPAATGVEALPPMRPPASSVHEWSPLLQELDRTIAQKVRDKAVPRFDSIRAKAMVEKAIHEVQNADDAATYRGLKDGGKKLFFQALGLLVAAATGWGIAQFGSCLKGVH